MPGWATHEAKYFGLKIPGGARREHPEAGVPVTHLPNAVADPPQRIE
jgi:hypothetical protein